MSDFIHCGFNSSQIQVLKIQRNSVAKEGFITEYGRLQQEPLEKSTTVAFPRRFVNV